MNRELEFYNEVKNWDFSKIKYIEECLTNWNMYDILNKTATKDSYILDLGTGGGEKLLEYFPEAKEIIGTDFSNEMIKTANNNLKKSNRTNIKFKQMDNLNITTENNYFDIVVARHTCIDAKQIYNTLKSNGISVKLLDKNKKVKHTKKINLTSISNNSGCDTYGDLNSIAGLVV